jgi:hypothetical protein
MSRPTQEEVREALEEDCKPVPGRPGEWVVAGHWVKEAQALDVAEICLIVGRRPVTDVLSGAMFLNLARRIADLEDRTKLLPYTL